MKKITAWVSDGTYRRELYVGTSPAKEIEMAQAAAMVLLLFKLEGRVYVAEGVDPHTHILYAADYVDGKRVVTTI